ncbi:hypothetical protein ABGB18_04105 [Nonomuraea sp. B12E4]|uniref:hypothetical protein n=1 Tax=Nonomuraea sp. B12E4 TaxID=3153564 RepID=UPI00325C5AA7
MSRPDRREMAYVEREHLRGLQALGYSHDRGVNCAEWEVRIPFDQHGNSGKITLGQLDEREDVRLESARNAASGAAPPNREII